MKKIIVISLFVLVLPIVALAAFSPATLTDGVKRVAVYTEAQANDLFSRGFILETKDAIGAFSSPNVMFDTVFHKTIKYKEKTASIALTTATATTTLTALDSGTTYYISATTTTIKLPVAASSTGATFRFVVGGALTATTSITSQTGDDIEGSLIVAGAVVDCDASDIVSFIGDGENLGDYVEFRTDGTKWFIGDSGALTAGKMTCSG